MIDLDKYLTETIDIKLIGKELHIKQPSVLFVKKFVGLSEKKSDEDVLDLEIQLVCEFLNDNLSNIRFTVEEIETLPQKTLMSIFDLITKAITDSDNDPN